MLRMFAVFPGSLLPAAALLIALAWPAHVAAADRSLADLNCPVSVLACASELNADCGGQLLARPDNFVLLQDLLPALPAGAAEAHPFLGRAPPFSL